jgi:DNA-binding SARP family transcriptional activator
MKFGILGPLFVSTDGRELPLAAPQQRTLLAVLLLHAGEPVSAARLIDDLWGEKPPATAGNAVRVGISELRKALGEGVIEAHTLGYVIRLEEDALDAARFERLLKRGRRLIAEGAAAEADQALELWRGSALADFRYEEFARSETARLDELRVVALEARLEAAVAPGRHIDAVPVLEGLVREHPLRERLSPPAPRPAAPLSVTVAVPT